MLPPQSLYSIFIFLHQSKFKMNKTKMKVKSFLVSFIAVLAVVLMSGFVAANDLNISVNEIYVNGIDVMTTPGVVAGIAGETIPIKIYLSANENAEDVEVSAYIRGYSEDRIVKDLSYDLIDGTDYTIRLSLALPDDIDETEETRTLKLEIETDSGDWRDEFDITIQREAYNVGVLFVETDDEIKAGSTLPVEVVIENIGSHELEDLIVKVEIPALSISRESYFGDLVPIECDENECCDEDDEDSASGILNLEIPVDAPAGNYKLKVTAYNDDASTSVSGEVVVLGAEVETSVIPSPASRTFALGSEVKYKIVLVNAGDTVKVYNVVPEASEDLAIGIEETVVAIPAGSTKTIEISVKALNEGAFSFAVDVVSDGEVIDKAVFNAFVEGRQLKTNPIVIWTIVLAIVFVVLLIVLIVLLTRKPEKTEELGESYY